MNNPQEIAQGFVATGIKKVGRPFARLFVLAFLGGIFIALAGVGATVASVSIPEASVAKLVGACIFPAGLAMVLIAGGELFTGNCLIAIAVLNKACKLKGMVYNLVVVYFGNMAGAMLIAWLVNAGHTLSLFDNGYAAAAIYTANAKCSLSFGDAFIRGILCNFLVCLAVWMAYAAKDAAGKIQCLFFPTMLFVLCGFEHCIANMYYIPAGLFALQNATYAASATAHLAELTWGNFFITNLIPVTLGNLVAGVLLGVGYWFVYLKAEEKTPATVK
ncbi:MAG TPA: formate/nitrite transporter family protein [Clostridia bacterium]|nr:formate/nitrite transporter family protein [Clostridia bacterium]